MFMQQTKDICIDFYDYLLPEGRIAKFPLERRDASKLLVYRDGVISESVFSHLCDFLPEGSLMVFNNTKVIQGRILFKKATGASIEIFCLEPIFPHDYQLVFQTTGRCVWKCFVGNAKRWKDGVLTKRICVRGHDVVLSASREGVSNEVFAVSFSWDDAGVCFADLLEAGGILPIPPYLKRESVDRDKETYQTVYSKVKGSVAAPTAGLHFTPDVLASLDSHGITREEVTLHVGAGTFKPVKSATLEGHVMHTEFVSVNREVIERLLEFEGRVIAVGTTTVRTLESLYFLGGLLLDRPNLCPDELVVSQWAPYEDDGHCDGLDVRLSALLRYLDFLGSGVLQFNTQIMIAPGYRFRVVRGMVTNFHQPKSTLLLLVDAFLGGRWRVVYDYALSHDFRFLSYGDSSLLFAP